MLSHLHTNHLERLRALRAAFGAHIGVALAEQFAWPAKLAWSAEGPGKKYKRMKSALHAFVAYMSHYHSVEWNNYMENQTPSSVNDLYKVGWKDYASKVFVDKPETWKKWNTISASTIAQHKNFTKFCDTLMETMNIEKPKKKSSQQEPREWKVKFPTMTIV